jgi:DnaJ-class molecular chaperone
VGPSFGALVERLFRNVTGVGVPKAARPAGLTFEVLLTPDEAARGVEVPIGVPRITPCGESGGRGHVWLFPCVSCREAGVIATERLIRILIRAGARSGAIIQLALDGFGVRKLYLRLRVRIE